MWMKKIWKLHSNAEFVVGKIFDLQNTGTGSQHEPDIANRTFPEVARLHVDHGGKWFLHRIPLARARSQSPRFATNYTGTSAMRGWRVFFFSFILSRIKWKSQGKEKKLPGWKGSLSRGFLSSLLKWLARYLSAFPPLVEVDGVHLFAL